jgi:hypothetical protein
MHKIARDLVTRDLCKKRFDLAEIFQQLLYSEIISSLGQYKENPFPSSFNLSESILFFMFSGREPLYSIRVC